MQFTLLIDTDHAETPDVPARRSDIRILDITIKRIASGCDDALAQQIEADAGTGWRGDTFLMDLFAAIIGEDRY